MSSSSIVHYAAPTESVGAAVEGYVMPTTFAFAGYAGGPPGRPREPRQWKRQTAVSSREPALHPRAQRLRDDGACCGDPYCLAADQQ